MERPVPVVLVEHVDAVGDVAVGPFRPVDGGELAHVDLGVVLLLEGAHGREARADVVLVPLLLGVGPRVVSVVRRLGVHALVGVLAGLVHVHLVDDVVEAQGGEVGEGVRAVPLDGLDDDGRRGVDLADFLGGEALERPVVHHRRAAGLDGLVDEVVAVDVGLSLEARGDPAPARDEVRGVGLVVIHREVVRLVAPARRHVEVDADLDAVFPRPREDVALEVVELAVEPPVEVGEVAVLALRREPARHLVAREGGAPCLEGLEVVFLAGAARQHHAAQVGLSGAQRLRRIAADPVLVDDAEESVRDAGLKRVEVEHNLPARRLQAEHEAPLRGRVRLEVLLHHDLLLLEVADAAVGVRPVRLAELVDPRELELQAEPGLRRLRDALAARAHRHLHAVAAVGSEVEVRPRRAAVLRLLGRHVHGEDAVLDPRVGSATPHEVRERQQDGLVVLHVLVDIGPSGHGTERHKGKKLFFHGTRIPNPRAEGKP